MVFYWYQDKCNSCLLMKYKKWQMWLWGVLQADIHLWPLFKNIQYPNSMSTWCWAWLYAREEPLWFKFHICFMFATLLFQDIFQQIQHSFHFFQMWTLLHALLPSSHLEKYDLLSQWQNSHWLL